uniref:DUF3800 domain-containing protein n=1 Tax=Sphingobacterium sp. (strain 21) TaxID=743722 RepID=F4C8V9_SPHS2
MKNMIAFADEFGNNSFDFENQGSHFIVASVILSKNKVNELEEQAETIRKKYFQTGEIKSSKVGPNHARRIKILAELVKLDFTIYAIAVDKRRLFGEGFKYKGSFYKFLNNIVYKELFRTFPDLSLVVDEHGSNDFMRSFKHYVEKNHVSDLFNQNEFQFAGSAKSVLVQLADFIAGSLGYCFDESKKSNNSKEILEMLKTKISSINYFPPQVSNVGSEAQIEDKSFDAVIAEISVRQARDFIDRKAVNSIYDFDQINCAKLLLLYFNSYDVSRYITTKEILKHLEIGREEPITEHTFRTQVIAKMRDAGVLIASSSSGERKGYKLPSNVRDLHKFVNHGKSVILPMLSRISKSRDKILLATQNQVDILAADSFADLRKLLDS